MNTNKLDNFEQLIRAKDEFDFEDTDEFIEFIIDSFLEDNEYLEEGYCDEAYKDEDD